MLIIGIFFLLQILLQSMHKYSVETVIEPVEPYGTPIVIPLPNTTFIAVTAYQNTRVSLSEGTKSFSPNCILKFTRIDNTS